jgi:hypothetical protein
MRVVIYKIVYFETGNVIIIFHKLFETESEGVRLLSKFRQQVIFLWFLKTIDLKFKVQVIAEEFCCFSL